MKKLIRDLDEEADRRKRRLRQERDRGLQLKCMSVDQLRERLRGLRELNEQPLPMSGHLTMTLLDAVNESIASVEAELGRREHPEGEK